MKQDNQTSPKTPVHNLIIVDESGSMQPLRKATLEGINQTIASIRESQKKYRDTQIHTLTVVTFCSGSKVEVRKHIDDMPIDRVKKFDRYQPGGCTPLFDAIGLSVTSLEQKIKDNEEAYGVVTIITDGEENSSTEWNIKSIKNLIDRLKEAGWVFTYIGSAHDVKKVTVTIGIENVIEFAHDSEAAENTWTRERNSRASYFDKIDTLNEERRRMGYSRETFMLKRKQMAKSYYAQRVTPRAINSLAANEIFVFGSSADGSHGGGAAGMAINNFGAVYGIGEGPQGQSYAIPTTNGLLYMKAAIERFILFAKQQPDVRFLVTPIGCGNAGYSPSEIAPLFKEAVNLENISLPAEFWDVLGLKF